MIGPVPDLCYRTHVFEKTPLNPSRYASLDNWPIVFTMGPGTAFA